MWIVEVDIRDNIPKRDCTVIDISFGYDLSGTRNRKIGTSADSFGLNVAIFILIATEKSLRLGRGCRWDTCIKVCSKRPLQIFNCFCYTGIDDGSKQMVLLAHELDNTSEISIICDPVCPECKILWESHLLLNCSGINYYIYLSLLIYKLIIT